MLLRAPQAEDVDRPKTADAVVDPSSDGDSSGGVVGLCVGARLDWTYVDGTICGVASMDAAAEVPIGVRIDRIVMRGGHWVG